jgi:predicted amidohydrolase
MGDSQYRIATVQPHTYLRAWGKIFPFTFDESAPPEAKTLDEAASYVSEAAGGGARYVAFPEMYPGPMSTDSPLTLEIVTEHLAARARKHGVWVLYGGAEVTTGGLHNTYNVLNPQGELAGRYRKMIPACGEPWLPGSQLLVVEADGLRLGLAICWEAWFPEIPRALAWMGADVIFFPTGALIYELRPRWSQILGVRAAENLVYTAASVNLLALEDGMAAIHSPEQAVAESAGPGILYGTIDLDRLAYLRRTDEELLVPKKYRSIPGLLRAMRPEVLEATKRATPKE